MDSKKSRMPAKGKKRANAAIKQPSKERRNVNRQDVDDDELRPSLPVERIPALMAAIQSRKGSQPTFFYAKRLEKFDVDRGLNSLYVTSSVRMMNYFKEKEAAAVKRRGRGLKIVGVDGRGFVYDDLRVTKWASLKMTVVDSDWSKVVDDSGAKKGDVVEIWGFRVDGKPYFAFNFRR